MSSYAAKLFMFTVVCLLFALPGAAGLQPPGPSDSVAAAQDHKTIAESDVDFDGFACAHGDLLCGRLSDTDDIDCHEEDTQQALSEALMTFLSFGLVVLGASVSKRLSRSRLRLRGARFGLVVLGASVSKRLSRSRLRLRGARLGTGAGARRPSTCPSSSSRTVSAAGGIVVVQTDAPRLCCGSLSAPEVSLAGSSSAQ
eukprot:TRINITY_DN24210_c0_g1_i2.p1 TRINITY_DN24210_c0_g1~~TRINITY_DN24210_c0_g1_i2.p1  ORF type:complete len:199 (+),score=45.23 TRINITY_DN24210_c0_g1_i2:113-709(+)